MDELIRVVLADDHPPTRAGVRMSLEADGFTVVGEASDARGCVALVVELEPDVALVDVNMPGTGVKAVGEIADRVPSTACVMLTVSREDDDLFAALRAGAVGYLLKDIDPARLPEALRSALRGEAALPRALVARLVDEFRGKGQRRIALPGRKAVDLTERELAVLEGLREGASTKEIAARLGVASVTVRSYVHTLLKKLRVPDRESAVRLFDETAD